MVLKSTFENIATGFLTKLKKSRQFIYLSAKKDTGNGTLYFCYKTSGLFIFLLFALTVINSFLSYRFKKGKKHSLLRKESKLEGKIIFICIVKFHTSYIAIIF